MTVKFIRSTAWHYYDESKTTEEKIEHLWAALKAEYLAGDPNEEYRCGNCGKEVVGRFLYCSKECCEIDEQNMLKGPEGE